MSTSMFVKADSNYAKVMRQHYRGDIDPRLSSWELSVLERLPSSGSAPVINTACDIYRNILDSPEQPARCYVELVSKVGKVTYRSGIFTIGR